MAEPATVVNSVTEALSVNASGVSSATTTASLSSSSSCISSASPTSSFGSGGSGSVVSEIKSETQQEAEAPQIETLKRLDVENADDSTNNVNTAASTTPSTGNNCNSSGEPVSDNEHRGSAEDIISHLNMLSMQDGLGFNGFGLLGTGTGSGTNVWNTAGMPNNISPVGNGMNKHVSNFVPARDQTPPQLGVANYIEALKIQQQLQLQQLKSGGLSSEMITNFFAGSTSSVSSPNFFGGPIMQNPNFRRPIYGAAGNANENLFAAPYGGGFFMNRGMHYPPPMEFGGHGRAVYKRPSSALKHPETTTVPSSIPSPTPSNIGMVMIPSNVAFTGLIPPATTTNNPLCAQHGSVRPNNNTRNSELFSRKVFVGGLPMDISEEEICLTFMRYGSVTVDWPHKAESKSYFPPKGYAFLIFHNETSVQALIDSCIQQDGRYYMCVSSPTMREKAVQIRPWRLSDADFVLDSSLPLDPRKTVFVGGVPRPLKAVELASILERLFGGVCYTGIDTDPELKYPKGAGRVSFSNQQSYIAAISARFVQLQHGDIDKRVEIKPYVLDDQMCDECGGARCGGKYAPYFCANVGCLQYYCDMCWQQIHSKAGREFHKPLVKEGTDRPRAVPFKWGI